MLLRGLKQTVDRAEKELGHHIVKNVGQEVVQTGISRMGISSLVPRPISQGDLKWPWPHPIFLHENRVNCDLRSRLFRSHSLENPCAAS